MEQLQLSGHRHVDVCVGPRIVDTPGACPAAESLREVRKPDIQIPREALWRGRRRSISVDQHASGPQRRMTTPIERLLLSKGEDVMQRVAGDDGVTGRQRHVKETPLD